MEVFNEKLAIEYLDVDKLQPYERNAKKHDAIIERWETFTGKKAELLYREGEEE